MYEATRSREAIDFMLMRGVVVRGYCQYSTEQSLALSARKSRLSARWEWVKVEKQRWKEGSCKLEGPDASGRLGKPYFLLFLLLPLRHCECDGKQQQQRLLQSASMLLPGLTFV